MYLARFLVSLTLEVVLITEIKLVKTIALITLT